MRMGGWVRALAAAAGSRDAPPGRREAGGAKGPAAIGPLLALHCVLSCPSVQRTGEESRISSRAGRAAASARPQAVSRIAIPLMLISEMRE